MPGRTKCPPGCECQKHSPERRRRLSELAKAQAAREGSAKRARQVASVWEKRTADQRQAIAAKVVSRTRGRKVPVEEIEKRRAGLLRSWENVPPEERLARVIPALEGRKRHRRISTLEANVAAALLFLEIEHEREKVVMDRYVVDFAIGKLLIEVDGTYWHDPAKDAIRDALLAGEGYTVIRIPENDAKHRPLQAVANALLLWGNRRGV